MVRSRRMNKHRSLCMIFIFPSLCSCSRILLPYCPLANFAENTVTLMCGPVVVSHVWPKMGIRPSAEPENIVVLVVPWLSSSSTTASSSTVPPQDLSISLYPANMRSNEGATANCSERVAGNCRRRRYSKMAGGLRREPRDRRSTCTRRDFSWLRSGTSCRCGITEAHYFCDLQRRKINFTNSKLLVGWLVSGTDQTTASPLPPLSSSLRQESKRKNTNEKKRKQKYFTRKIFKELMFFF